MRASEYENKMKAIKNPVLVLSQSYEAVNVCHVRRAIVLILCGKAEMLENGRGFVRSISNTFPIPSVIKLDTIVRRPRTEARMTRYGIFRRDRYTCQYCGKTSHQLTLDHVIPRRQGGEHTWENLTSACAKCNRRKAGRTPKQANMKLLSQPRKPRGNMFFHIPDRYLQNPEVWQKYLFNGY